MLCRDHFLNWGPVGCRSNAILFNRVGREVWKKAFVPQNDIDTGKVFSIIARNLCIGAIGPCRRLTAKGSSKYGIVRVVCCRDGLKIRNREVGKSGEDVDECIGGGIADTPALVYCSGHVGVELREIGLKSRPSVMFNNVTRRAIDIEIDTPVRIVRWSGGAL